MTLHHEPFSREDLDAIEKEMKKIIKKGAKIERFTKSREDAIAYFKEKNEPYKVELIEDLPEGCRNFFLFSGRLDRPLRRTTPDERERCQGIQTSFIFQRLLERKRKERNADTYLRNSLCYPKMN